MLRVLPVIFLLLAAAAVEAQDRGRGRGRGRGRERASGAERILGGSVNNLTERLELDDDQKEQLEEIYKETQTLAEAIGQRWGEYRILEEKARESFTEILTEEQKEQYEESRRSRQRRGRRGGNQAPVDDLKRDLDLDDESAQKITEIRETLSEDLREVMTEARESGDWDAAREEGAKLRAGALQEEKDLLTDEQREEYETILKKLESGEYWRERARRGRIDRLLEAIDAKDDDDIRDHILKVIDLQEKVTRKTNEMRFELRRLLKKEEEVGDTMDELRTELGSLEGELSEAQKALEELLDPTQVAHLVTDGILK